MFSFLGMCALVAFVAPRLGEIPAFSMPWTCLLYTSENEYLPHNHIPNCVVYPGTHDNTTLRDWLKNGDPKELARAKNYLGLNAMEGSVRGLSLIHISCVRRVEWTPVAHTRAVSLNQLDAG